MRLAKRLMCWCIAAFMVALTVSPALAEFTSGSQGDDVEQLQMKLYNMGFMEDKPDGEFGEGTEEGLRVFQRYLGTEETGLADGETLAALERIWNLAIGITDVTAAPASEESEYPDTCQWAADTEAAESAQSAAESTEAEESAPDTLYCVQHAGIRVLKELRSAENTPPRLMQLLAARESAMWLRAIDEMYEEWDASLGRKEKDIAGEHSNQFRDALTAKRKEWETQYGRVSEQRHLAEAAWMEQAGMELCLKIHGALSGAEANDDAGKGIATDKEEEK